MLFTTDYEEKMYLNRKYKVIDNLFQSWLRLKIWKSMNRNNFYEEKEWSQSVNEARLVLRNAGTNTDFV